MNKKWLRASDAYLMSFLLPVIIMLVIFVSRGIFPFGEESFLRTDMYHQYAPFFSEFQYKLRHGGSLLYSWNVGLGVNFAALYAYYLASPLNFLLLLVPKAFVLEFMSYMIVLKIGLSGLTASIYFRKHFGKRSFSSGIFGILYAMSGYLSAYSWNIMWLDCILLFPLILLGMEKLLRGESPLLYTLSLGLSILSNYYISIMICLFLVIYFFTEEILHSRSCRESFFRRAGKFALFSLLSGGLAAVTLLPEIFALQGTASGKLDFPSTVSQYFTILDMLARHLPNVATEQGLDHWPNIYCGTVVFLLLPLYFMNRRIELKEKLVYGCLLLFFYLSFSVNVLNFIWHGFHYPNSLPCRQSFIYILLLLSMAYHAFLKRRYIRRSELGKALGVGLFLLILMQKLVTEDAIHWSSYYIGMVLLLLYFGLLYLEKGRAGRRRENLLLMAGLLLITVETAVNMAATSVTTTSRTSYVSDNRDVEKLVQSVREEDRRFYRFEKISRKTKDDGAWMNFPSVSLFSSTAYKECSDFFQKLGMEASTNAYSITGATPLMDMLFSVKYALYTGELDNAEALGKSYRSASGSTYLYENRYILPLGYFLSDQQLHDWSLEQGTPALVQNSLAESLGEQPVLIPKLGSFDGEDYSFNADKAGEYYVYVNASKVKKVKVYTEKGESDYDNVDRGYFLELGYLKEGEDVRIHSETSGQSMDCSVYYFDSTALQGIYEKLSRNTLELTEWRDSFLKGRATAPKEGIVMTSIPYDKGWKLYVDGKEAEAEVVQSTFLGIRLSEGAHEIELRYFPEGLKLGAMISLLSLLLLIGILYFLPGVLWLRAEDAGKPGNAGGFKPELLHEREDLSGMQSRNQNWMHDPNRRNSKLRSLSRTKAGRNNVALEIFKAPEAETQSRIRGQSRGKRAFSIPEVVKEKEIEVPDIKAMEAEGLREKIREFPRWKKPEDEE